MQRNIPRGNKYLTTRLSRLSRDVGGVKLDGSEPVIR